MTYSIPGNLPFTDAAQRLLAAARDESDLMHHEYLGTEHIVLALTQGPNAAAYLAPLGVDGGQIRTVLIGILAPHDALIPDTGGGPAVVSPRRQLPLTSRTNVALTYAGESARKLGHRGVGIGHLLVGLMQEGRNVGAQLLHEHGLTLATATAVAAQSGNES